MASSPTGAASFYAATAQQAIAAAVPPSPQPWLKVVSWNSGPARKVSCSLNGTRAKIVNCHLVNGSAQGTMEGQPWDSKLTPTIKDEAIAELARRYGGGASEPITLIGGLQPQEEGGAASQK